MSEEQTPTERPVCPACQYMLDAPTADTKNPERCPRCNVDFEGFAQAQEELEQQGKLLQQKAKDAALAISDPEKSEPAKSEEIKSDTEQIINSQNQQNETGVGQQGITLPPGSEASPTRQALDPALEQAANHAGDANPTLIAA